MDKSKKQKRIERTIKRNQKVKDRYAEMTKKHPQWRHDAILEEMEDEFNLASTTLHQIVSGWYDKYYFKKD